MVKKESEIGYRKILMFWSPLAATWLMMALEGPFLAAVIARLPEAKYNLAAFGVSFSFALIFEAPIIMIMSASTALVKDNESLFKLKRFTFFLNLMITLIMLIALVPPVFFTLTQRIMKLPPDLARLTYQSTLFLLPWPAAIGFRRFNQGILISSNKTSMVTYGTIVRLLTVSSSALIFSHFGLQGAHVGAAALSTGVTCECIATRLMVNKSIRRLSNLRISGSDAGVGTKITYRFIFHFYFPLAVSSILILAAQPIVTFFMGWARFPIESLAVLPVVNSLVFLFRSLAVSYQEVGIALIGSKWENYRKLRNFAFFLGSILILGLTIISFSPLAIAWFRDVSALPEDLTTFALLPLRLMIALPVLSTFLSFQRSILINARRTSFITWGTILELAIICVVLGVSIHLFDMIGAVAAAVAFLIGRISSNSFFMVPILKVLKAKVR